MSSILFMFLFDIGKISVPPVTISYMLTEDGNRMLTEDGNYMILE